MQAPEPKGIWQPKPPEGIETFNAVCFKVTYEEDHEFGQHQYNPGSDLAWAIITHWQIDLMIPDEELGDPETGKMMDGYEIFRGKRHELTKTDRLSCGEKANIYKYFHRLTGQTIENYLDSHKEGDQFIGVNSKTGIKFIEWDGLVGMSAFIEVETKPTKKGHLYAAVKDVQKRHKDVKPIEVMPGIQWPERDDLPF